MLKLTLSPDESAGGNEFLRILILNRLNCRPATQGRQGRAINVGNLRHLFFDRSLCSRRGSTIEIQQFDLAAHEKIPYKPTLHSLYVRRKPA